MRDTIEPFIHRTVIMLNPEATAGEAAQIMSERATGCVIIADDGGHLMGIVTDRDLACQALTSEEGPDTPLLQIMSKHVIAVDEDAKVTDVLHAMQSKGVRRIPVVNLLPGDKRKCIGLVTLDDLVASECVGIKQVAPIVRRQMIRRRARSEAHRRQSVKHFEKNLAQAIGLDEDVSMLIAKFVLSALIQRVHYTGAAHLLAQLPIALQDELLNVPAGPNRNITVESLLTGLMLEFQVDEATARSILVKVFGAFTDLIDPGEVEHIKSQLPDEFRALFVGSERARSKLTAA